ncbi:MAG: M1 family aminopeptidase [Bacteroidales bacterium]
MPGRQLLHLLCVVAGTLVLTAVQAAAQPAPDGVTTLLRRFERVVATGTADAYQDLLAPGVDVLAARSAVEALTQPPPTRAAVRERDRACGQDACRLVVDIWCEFGAQARLATWRLDVRRGADGGWLIAGQSLLNVMNGLFRLSLDPLEAYSARGVVVEAEDFRVRMADGSVFVAKAAGQPTALVLIGRGELTFAPAPATERGQVRIFAGTDQLQTAIESLVIRVNPDELASHISGLAERQSEVRDLKRAEEIFRENNIHSFAIDVPDLSAESWSLIPRQGDFVAEASTKRFGTLTYSVADSEAEDVVVFDRKARRNIAQYASRAKLAARGPFYDDSEQREYDVDNYEVNARFAPARGWIEARVRMSITVRSASLNSLTVRLDDGLTVREVSALELGRLMPLRVRGRNALVVTLPSTVTKGTRLTLLVDYSGVVRSQRLDRETIELAAANPQEGPAAEPQRSPVEPSYVYSNRPYWYPQPSVNGYSTALLRLSVPAPLSVVASGELVPQPGDDRAGPRIDAQGYRQFVFAANQPVRYLSAVITPLVQVRDSRVRYADGQRADERRAPGAYYDAVDVRVQTNPREKGLAGDLHKQVSDIVRFYASVIGDCPYPTINIALVEQELPGGHSPAYLSAINHVSPRTSVSWKSDPAYIANFPEYFIAHEVAHQWWGQAVGWKNYHEQWLSEGFAQYFAALFAEHAHGKDAFQEILRQWQRWAIERSEQGPVYLGYRVGHIKGDSRTFRAVVYDKGALVLHMLRRWVGDEAFFRGLRRFYGEWRFRRAGTDDLQRAMEAEAHTSLQRFFDRWIYGDTLPRVRAVTSTETVGAHEELVVRLRQEGTVFDVPVTVSLDYAGRPGVELTVRLAQAQQEFRIPLVAPLRKVELNRAHVALLADLAIANAAGPPASSARGPRPR